MALELKDTLNLPVTDFPMRASLVEREPKRIEHWENSGLYRKILEKRQGAEKYVLHDGPPFTNGDVHIGTALNKILKSAIVRYKSMRGYQTPYVPGWDCHGLPIEFKVVKALHEKKRELSEAELRKECAAFSAGYIETQRKQFKRLGILADWEHEYKTMNPAYEAEILRTFAKFVEKGLVYRDQKPIYYSIPCATALAEFEIEYKDHTSPSIYVKFPLPEAEAKKVGVEGKAFVIIWTTTPWTLPANLGISLHADLDYQEIKANGETYLVAEKRVEVFTKSCGISEFTLGKTFKGKAFEGVKCRHPFIDRDSLIVLGDHVTLESGTGCVHTAPGHGTEDYIIGKQYGLEVYSPLDDKGCYINDGRVPEELVGKSVLEKNGKSDANEGVLEILKRDGMLLHLEKMSHSYPHCWRSKTPVIFRAMDQWFVKLDGENGGVRKQALEALKGLDWDATDGYNRLSAAVENRPDWCISRQRTWGVPLPAFYDEDGNALLDASVILKLADKVESEGGTDIWFEKSAEELLKGIELPEAFRSKKLTQGRDTLDVWIDSGCSHRAVLKKNPELAWPADLYFEGSDQHRGWFQSSLWTGIIADEAAPYKKIITHGFVVDENRKKVSKSDGKPQTAESFVNQYGADIIRLWICSEEFRRDVTISDNILKNVSQTYRTIRNTLRFQLGNLYDFDFKKDKIEVEKMTVVDKWVMHQTAVLIEEVTKAFDEYQFHKGYQLLSRYCATTLSAFYHDVLKDRLYTYAPNAQERRSSQTAIHHSFEVLVKLIAPILAFTAEEAYEFCNDNKEYGDSESVHLADWPVVGEGWKNEGVESDFKGLFKVRDLVNEKLEAARQAKTLGQSLDAKVVLNVGKDHELRVLLEKYRDFLPELFIVSQVNLIKGEGSEIDLEIQQAEGVRCPRSWRWVSQLVPVEGFGEVSPRCREALLAKFPQNTLSQT